MKPQYQQAIRIGLTGGIVLAVIYFAAGLAGLFLNSTPAMQNYTEKVTEPFREMWKNWPNSVQPITYPVSTPTPPIEYYINMMVSSLSLLAVAVGLLVIGPMALRAGKQAEYRWREAISTGALSGAVAFLPVIVVMVLLSAISAVMGFQTNTLSAMMPPGMAVSIPFVIIAGLCCCCAPVGLVIAAIIAAIGALAWLLLSGRHRSSAMPPNP